MRTVLLTAAAIAPLLALMGGVAEAACPSASGVSTSTVGDIDMVSGCTIKPGTGNVGITLNSNNTVVIESGAAISNTDVNNSTGIVVVGGNTGSVDNLGSISLLMSFQPTSEGNTGIAGGPFATGQGRIGIDVTGSSPFVGTITNDSGGSITIDGNSVAGAPTVGIFIQSGSGVTGDLVDNGAITMTGNQTQAINIAGAVGGNVTLGGSISALGVGAQGVVTSASIGGALTIGGAISTTGYRSTTAPTNLTILDQLGADQVQQGGSSVIVGGSVGQGITLNGAISTGSGSSLTTTAAASVTEFGSAPAIVIGSATQAITVGNTTGDPNFALVVGGSVAAEGVYDKTTTPNLAAPASATAITIGGLGGTVNLSGGIHIIGEVSASSLDAPSTGVEIGAGTSMNQILIDGTIASIVSANSPQSVVGLKIDESASVSSIVVNGVITATISETASGSGTAEAINDQSGSVGSIVNTGEIIAALTPTDVNFTLAGPRIAIDESKNTTGVTITQSPSTTFDGQAAAKFTGSISGTTLTVSSLATGSGNLSIGETITGVGIATGTTIAAEVTGTGGTGTYTLSTTQNLASESLTGTGGTPTIIGDVLLGSGVNTLDIEAGAVTGAVTEIAGQRDLTFNVAANPGTQATVSITQAEGHQVTSLNVGAGGILTASVDPSFAIGGSNPTPIFDTTVHPGETGVDGTATFATGAQIGVALDALQTAPTATYIFVQTSGAPGALNVGTLSATQPVSAPFLYTTTTSSNASDVLVTLALKTPEQLGLNPSGIAAFPSVFAALEKNPAIADAVIAQTTQFGFLGLYNQMIPDQGIGTFESLEAATQKIAGLTEQPPDAGTRIGGTSAWLQEVNTVIKRMDGATLGDTDKVFGLVGGYEKAGAGGGALGLTLAYLNIGSTGTATPVNGNLTTDLAEVGAYYRRAWGDLHFSVRGAGGYAWFNERREFVTNAVNATSYGGWNGYFGDAHVGAEYELHVSRFYVRPNLSADYLYLNENAHDTTGAGPGFDLQLAQRASERMTAQAIVTIGTQYGHDAWFRPEIFGGYRQVVFGGIANTVGELGGVPFDLSPGDVNGGWIVAGFSLRAGTPLSYVAIEGEADVRNNEQRYDIYLSGRSMF